MEIRRADLWKGFTVAVVDFLIEQWGEEVFRAYAAAIPAPPEIDWTPAGPPKRAKLAEKRFNEWMIWLKTPESNALVM